MIISFLDEAGAMRCEVAVTEPQWLVQAWLVRVSIRDGTRRYGNYGDQVGSFRERKLICTSYSSYNDTLRLFVLLLC